MNLEKGGERKRRVSDAPCKQISPIFLPGDQDSSFKTISSSLLLARSRLKVSISSFFTL